MGDSTKVTAALLENRREYAEAKAQLRGLEESCGQYLAVLGESTQDHTARAAELRKVCRCRERAETKVRVRDLDARAAELLKVCCERGFVDQLVAAIDEAARLGYLKP